MLVTQSSGRLRQKDQTFRPSLSNLERLCPKIKGWSQDEHTGFSLQCCKTGEQLPGPARHSVFFTLPAVPKAELLPSRALCFTSCFFTIFFSFLFFWGIELGTFPLQGRCGTTKLNPWPFTIFLTRVILN